MATVIFASDLQAYTGEEHLQSTARVYRDLASELLARYPLLSDQELGKWAVAIDGVIIADPFLDEIAEDSEVYFMHKIAGG